MSVELQPYLVDPRLAPFDTAMPPNLNVFNPFSVDVAPFIVRLRALDEAAYGPRNLAAPAWVFYDCGLVPGATLGYGVETPDGLVPLSLLVALPTADPYVVLVHSLAIAPDVADVPTLWRRTWRLAMDLLSPRGVLVTESWSDPAMKSLAVLGPSRVFVANHPAHDIAATATIGIDPAVRDVDISALPPNFVAADTEALIHLQARLDDGCSCWYLGQGPDGAHAFHVAATTPPALLHHAFAAGGHR